MPQPVWESASPRVPGGRIASTYIGSGPQEIVILQLAQGSTRGPRRSTYLDLPSNPILGRTTCLDLPGDLISMRLPRHSLPGDLHPDPGIPSSQVATVLGRIRFRKAHP